NCNLNIDILPMAISDSVDITHFHIAQRGRATSYLASSTGSSQTGGIRETQLVPCATLDWIAERYELPNFVKIDIEGAELLALNGAQHLLSKARPSFLIEVSSENQYSITNILLEHDYVLYNASNVSAKQIALASFNTLAFPKEEAL
ncbi:MAG: FkbM family methyltransferase, partial [Nitrospira sp.]|nr:FkbM family methyltransferase [Nitrospira sp.]